ncbi:MAG: hypothetical protein M0018_03790 [Nitrospiraceae bacterium]|nr:hypothetical protein [Nitrospiraceae bacterium]
MKKTAFILVVLMLMSFAACTEEEARGGTTGGIIGGIAGLFLDSDNPWRGGVVGATIGAIAGATLADISNRGSLQVADTGRPVEYTTDNGRGRYYAEPEGYNPVTKCTKVRERIWDNGRMVKDRVKEVCKSERYEDRY